MGIGPVRCFTAAAVVATALGIGPGGPMALACDFDCAGYGYAPAYDAPYGPPVYGYADPVAIYAPPPPYAYAYAPPIQVNYYYTRRITVLRRPRRVYRARFRPRAYRGGCRHARVCGRRGTRCWRR